MAVRPRNMEFRKQLYHISNQLSNSDVNNLKFLCTDFVPRRQLEDINTGFDLFSALEGIDDALGPDNLEFLEELLKTLHKGHLVRKLKAALARQAGAQAGAQHEEFAPQPSLTSAQDRSLSIKFGQFLVGIGNDLPERHLRDIAYFFQSYDVKGLNAQALQKLRDPAVLFDILKQEGLISPTNLSKLRAVLDAIGRKDLCSKVDAYLQSAGVGAAAQEEESGEPLSQPQQETMPPNGSGPLQHPTVAVSSPEGDSMSSENFSFSEPLPSDFSQPRSNVKDYSGGRPGMEAEVQRRWERNAEAGRGREQKAEMVIVAGGGGVQEREMKHERPLVPRPVVTASEGARQRTRTQLLQQQLIDSAAQIRQLEQQQGELRGRQEHEQAHNHMMLTELERKNREVEELRQETDKLRKQLETAEDTELYPMNMEPPHGKAIIIVNENFRPNLEDPSLELKKRDGAQEDLRLFKEMFHFLDYAVESYKDLTALEMHEVIAKAAIEDHRAYDSLVCCVSTHGDENVMYGTDSVGVKRSELLQPLKQSLTLNRKPKMFFFQACRTKVDTTANSSSAQPLYQPNAADQDADIFIANATTTHNASYRSHVNGSWFVSALHLVFLQHAERLTLSQMMHKVNNMVCDARGTLTESAQYDLGAPQEVRQCAESTSSFRMGLRFKSLHIQ